MLFFPVLLLFFGYLFSRTYIPAWPGDFQAYLGAGCALAEKRNLYDEDTAMQMLSRYGLENPEPLPFIYSPAFAIPFSAVRYLGISTVRRIWFLIIHVSFWAGLLLLFLRNGSKRKTIILLLCTGIPLIFIGPFRASVYWGQATAPVFLLLSVALYFHRRSSAEAVSFSLLFFIKPALMLPAVTIGRKKLIILLAAVTAILVCSVLFTGAGPWEDYLNSLRNTSHWDFSMAGNRSLLANISRAVNSASAGYIREARGIRQERIARAERIRTVLNISFAGTLLAFLSVLIRTAGTQNVKAVLKSSLFPDLLTWLIPLVSPLAYDHYALFLLPLLISAMHHKRSRLLIPALSAFIIWSFVPTLDETAFSKTLCTLMEFSRPAALMTVSICAVKQMVREQFYLSSKTAVCSCGQ